MGKAVSVRSVTFKPDRRGIASLNDPNGLVGRGTERAAEKTAERVRQLIVGYGLVDTGAMLADVTVGGREQSADRVRLQVGTPNTPYSLYQDQRFFTEALERVTVGDWNQ